MTQGRTRCQTATVVEQQTDSTNANRTPRLTLRPSRHVRWTSDTCDNEDLNRKSSKICCIYHPPTEFGESSEEEDDEETDSEAEEELHRPSRPNAYERQPRRRAPPGGHPGGHHPGCSH